MNSCPNKTDDHVELKDDYDLLDMMLTDSKHQPPLYHPGPYWAAKANNATNEIKRCGIGDFRGSSNLIGLSYADNLFIDIRDGYNNGLIRRFVRCLTKTYPLSKIYEAQISWTKSYAQESIAYAQEILNIKESTRNLLTKYHMPYSLLGNCLAKAKIDGQDLSIHYLNLLEQHGNIASRIDFNGAKSIFEIGGGLRSQCTSLA